MVALTAGSVLLGCNAEPDGRDRYIGFEASHATTRHVLIVSLDGAHEFDLERYVAEHPSSALATLVTRGTQYTNATSSRPSDSFPGTLAMTTGGSPASTGIYYDVSWDDKLSPPGSACATRGATVTYDGLANVDDTVVDAELDPGKLPLDPDAGCTPVYPHRYLQVNTIFELAKAAGYRTALTDKHPSYELLNGPSGTGLDELYTPENDANGVKKDITKATAYDETKVQAVLAWIDGYDHTRTAQAAVPGLMMMNFQSVNIGQKVGGYVDASGTPSPGLAGALDYVDGAIGRIVQELQTQNLTQSTLLIMTAKHGNTPVDLSLRRAIAPALIDATVESVAPGLLAQNTPDTISLLWLRDRSRTRDVVAALQANAAALGIEKIYSEATLHHAYGGTLALVPNRCADIIIEPQPGVIYTTSIISTKKVEHGSFNDEATHVPLVLAGPGVAAGTVHVAVDLRQVASTALKALDLHPQDLDAVRLEHTHRLPKADDDCTISPCD
ncbi:MAG TPA: alkaline phosphatase family protein [Kofleriaceae bacterium]|jgi:hypothetical protein